MLVSVKVAVLVSVKVVMFVIAVHDAPPWWAG
jgi:hypothetical protein